MNEYYLFSEKQGKEGIEIQALAWSMSRGLNISRPQNWEGSLVSCGHGGKGERGWHARGSGPEEICTRIIIGFEAIGR